MFGPPEESFNFEILEFWNFCFEYIWSYLWHGNGFKQHNGHFKKHLGQKTTGFRFCGPGKIRIENIENE